jgi:hypothetical protein
MTARLAIIHVAKKQLGLDEDAYRAILSGAGVDSAGEITTAAQFNPERCEQCLESERPERPA